MDYNQFVNLAGRRKQTVFIITVVFLIIVALFTFLQPLRYSATSRLLVVQNYGPNTDAYNVSRSNQFLSNLLAQVVYSDSFYEQVMASGYNINQNIFSKETNKRKQEWQNMVYTRAIADTGMISLKVYHQDKIVANKINQAIAYTLMTKNSQYHGLGDNVKVKVIDSSTLSDWPVKPNIILNLLLGLLAGLAVSLYLIYLFPGLALGFNRGRRRSQDPSSFINQYEPEPIYGQTEEIENQPDAAEPATYSPAEILNDNYFQPETVEQEIEATGGEDEFEPYFGGNINNLIHK